MIEINSLYKSFGSLDVLKNISLKFEKGTVYGIVGNNGAGKTTLFRCIAALENYRGKILCPKNEIIKDKLGFLPTNPYFFSKITGLEYLQLMINARKIKLKNLKDMNIFDLPLEKYASTYSTGMKKKLALTGLLIQKNEIFLLDEPFNGVDIHSNLLIEKVIEKLKKSNKIIIISSHIFSTLKDTCDQLHHLKNGEIFRSVNKNDFDIIEKDMKASGVLHKIDALEI